MFLAGGREPSPISYFFVASEDRLQLLSAKALPRPSIHLFLQHPRPPIHTVHPTHLLFGLEVVEEDGAFLGLLTPVTHDDAGAIDDFAGIPFTIQDAYFHSNRKTSAVGPNPP